VALYAVSVDPPATSRELKRKLKSRFTFLSDPDGELLDALGIRHRREAPADEPEMTDIAFPTAILVDAKGLVRWTYQSDTYRQRARPAEIFAAIEAMRTPGSG
jgi:peroxiredoxin